WYRSSGISSSAGSMRGFLTSNCFCSSVAITFSFSTELTNPSNGKLVASDATVLCNFVRIPEDLTDPGRANYLSASLQICSVTPSPESLSQ
ncbi:hypothetical protein PMAYCL1PPCAC_30018, partial [Pristionchus mayeri]